MNQVNIKASESKREAMKFAYGLVQVVLCLVGAYLVASGFSLFSGEDATLNVIISKGTQRFAGMIAFFVGSFMWWFEDYIF